MMFCNTSLHVMKPESNITRLNPNKQVYSGERRERCTYQGKNLPLSWKGPCNSGLTLQKSFVHQILCECHTVNAAAATTARYYQLLDETNFAHQQKR